MLVNTEDFEVLEKILREKGKIQKFENECGKILGRVMITFGEIPENLKDDILSGHKEEELYIFNCSFDFYETLIGIAIGKNDMKPVPRIWVTEQEEGAEKPSKAWLDFFIRMLYENVLNNDIEFGIPIYIFVNDESEMVITPTLIK